MYDALGRTMSSLSSGIQFCPGDRVTVSAPVAGSSCKGTFGYRTQLGKWGCETSRTHGYAAPITQIFPGEFAIVIASPAAESPPVYEVFDWLFVLCPHGVPCYVSRQHMEKVPC